jgi:molybdopterin converting factor subunit 1
MRVLFFAQLQDATGCNAVELPSAALTRDELWRELLKKFPLLAGHRGNVRLARNWEYAEADAVFSGADEVALIPPVSGG